MTQEDKDRMKQEAMQVFIRTYGFPASRCEVYLVTKGIEAMAAVAFAKWAPSNPNESRL